MSSTVTTRASMQAQYLFKTLSNSDLFTAITSPPFYSCEGTRCIPPQEHQSNQSVKIAAIS